MNVEKYNLSDLVSLFYIMAVHFDKSVMMKNQSSYTKADI